MRLVKVTLQGNKPIVINPMLVSHLQPMDGRPGCMLFMDGDNLPTNLEDNFLELQAHMNNALYDDSALYSIRNEFVVHAGQLIEDLKRMILVTGAGAAIIIILLLILITRGH